MSKIYAVKVGRKTGLFHSWEEREKQVKGYKGAIYKSFSSEEEAKNYLRKPTKKVKPKQKKKKKKAAKKKNTFESAYDKRAKEQRRVVGIKKIYRSIERE